MSTLVTGGVPISACPSAGDCGTVLSDTDTLQSGVNLRIQVTGTCPGAFAFPGDQDVIDQLFLEAPDMTVTGFVLSDPESALLGALQNIIPGAAAVIAGIQMFIYATANGTLAVGQLRGEVINAMQAVNTAKAISCQWSVGEMAQVQQSGQTVSQAVAAVADDVAKNLPSTSSVGLVLVGVALLAIGLLVWINKLEATA